MVDASKRGVVDHPHRTRATGSDATEAVHGDGGLPPGEGTQSVSRMSRATVPEDPGSVEAVDCALDSRARSGAIQRPGSWS